jgi:hypothetical protein
VENYGEETSRIKEGKGFSDQTDLAGFLLVTGQSDQTLPEGWRRMKKLIRYPE